MTDSAYKTTIRVADSRVLRHRPVDPESAQDLADLVELRTLCGWCADLVPSWMEHIRRGDLLYYFFYNTEGHDKASKPIGSGGLDLNLGTDGQDCSSKANEVGCIVGLFVRKEYAGFGYGKQMAKFFVRLGFADRALKTLTCINKTDNPITMKMFTDLHFTEFKRETMDHWEVEDSSEDTPVGSFRRLAVDEYLTHEATFSDTPPGTQRSC